MPRRNPAARPRANDDKVRLRVLLKNKRACCICHSSDKALQIHHIDGDRSHSVELNLAVLCLTHHDQATAGLRRGNVGLGVKLIPTEVRAHKVTWETAVANELAGARRATPQKKRKQLQVLFEFEVIKAKNEILTARRKEIVKARLNFLTEFLIEEFVSGIPYRRVVLEAFSDIATRAAGEERISLSLISAIPSLHLHLVGPDKVKMYDEDRNALLKSIEVLDTLGFYGVTLARRARIVRDSCKVLAELAEIASWYRFASLISRVKRALKGMLREFNGLPLAEKRGVESKKKLKLITLTLGAIKH